MGRQHQRMDRPRVHQVPEGNAEQRKMEETGCEIIYGALATPAVKGSVKVKESGTENQRLQMQKKKILNRVSTSSYLFLMLTSCFSSQSFFFKSCTSSSLSSYLHVVCRLIVTWFPWQRFCGGWYIRSCKISFLVFIILKL